MNKEKNPVGRPPKYFQAEELPVLGEDLIKWVTKEGRNNVLWVRWYMKHNLFENDWKDLVQRSEFRPYYERARKIMVENIMQNKDLAQSYGNRYLAMYDRDLHEHEEGIRDREARRKQVTTSEETLTKAIDEMKSLHSHLYPKQTEESNISSVENN